MNIKYTMLLLTLEDLSHSSHQCTQWHLNPIFKLTSVINTFGNFKTLVEPSSLFPSLIPLSTLVAWWSIYCFWQNCAQLLSQRGGIFFQWFSSKTKGKGKDHRGWFDQFFTFSFQILQFTPFFLPQPLLFVCFAHGWTSFNEHLVAWFWQRLLVAILTILSTTSKRMVAHLFFIFSDFAASIVMVMKTGVGWLLLGEGLQWHHFSAKWLVYVRWGFWPNEDSDNSFSCSILRSTQR